MITALISGIFGIFSGAAPKILNEVLSSREEKREDDRLEKQVARDERVANLKAGMQESAQDHEMARDQVQIMAKLETMDRNFDATVIGLQRDIAVATSKPIGVKWVDAWNASMRPFAVTLILLLFAFIAVGYSYEVITTSTSMKEAGPLLWASVVGESIQAVLGFLFGYRSVRK